MWIRKDVKLVEEIVGTGPVVERLKNYTLAIRLTLSHGDIVRRPDLCLSSYYENRYVDKEGFFVHGVRFHRENFRGGFFYALDGMKIGGYRKVIIGPHLAYREEGIPGVIPPNAKITVEIKVLGDFVGYVSAHQLQNAKRSEVPLQGKVPEGDRDKD
jgi:hypothetical protein